MTVTVYIDLTVECDFCGKKRSQILAEKEGRIDTVFLARFHSRNQGWGVINGQDICPGCKALRKECNDWPIYKENARQTCLHRL